VDDDRSVGESVGEAAFVIGAATGYEVHRRTGDARLAARAGAVAFVRWSAILGGIVGLPMLTLVTWSSLTAVDYPDAHFTNGPDGLPDGGFDSGAAVHTHPLLAPLLVITILAWIIVIVTVMWTGRWKRRHLVLALDHSMPPAPRGWRDDLR
jgi:hypothetical protein